MPLPNIGLTCKFHFNNMDKTYEVRAKPSYFITCFAGHTIRWLSSNFISFIHVIKMKLTSESDIWKRHAKSCTKSPNLKRNNFKILFDHLSPKASAMHYWKGPQQTLKEAPMRYSMDDDPSLFLKPGPGRKLKLKLEL
jgi:hypothetical protein